MEPKQRVHKRVSVNQCTLPVDFARGYGGACQRDAVDPRAPPGQTKHRYLRPPDALILNHRPPLRPHALTDDAVERRAQLVADGGHEPLLLLQQRLRMRMPRAETTPCFTSQASSPNLEGSAAVPPIPCHAPQAQPTNSCSTRLAWRLLPARHSTCEPQHAAGPHCRTCARVFCGMFWDFQEKAVTPWENPDCWPTCSSAMSLALLLVSMKRMALSRRASMPLKELSISVDENSTCGTT